MDLSEAAAGLNLCCGDVWATAFLCNGKGLLLRKNGNVRFGGWLKGLWHITGT